MKYIKIGTSFYIFSETETHATVARKIGGKVDSAGFVSITDEPLNDGIDDKTTYAVTCHGESISLGIKSDPNDSVALMKQIRGY